jgi:hypothetical protein
LEEVAIGNSVEKREIGGGILICSSLSIQGQKCTSSYFSMAYKSSTRYGAEENDAFNPTFIDGDAETHSEWRYVVANNAPVKPQGNLKSPIVAVVQLAINSMYSGAAKFRRSGIVLEMMNLAIRQRKNNY